MPVRVLLEVGACRSVIVADPLGRQARDAGGRLAGANRFGVEVFDPETANALMAALLVRDLHVEPEVHDHPWQDEAHEAVHGGLWRAPWAPPSALGLSSILGWAGTRS